MALITQWAAVILACLSLCLAQVSIPYDNGTAPLSTFKSRPDIEAPILNITVFDEANVTPGYIFIAPYQTAQQSVYIYDNRGNLVWSGFGPTGAGPSHNFHVCPINGTDQLCYFTGYQNRGYARGHGVIMNNKFTTIASIQSQAGLPGTDQHEFNIVNDGKSALVSIYEAVQSDLSAYNITSGQGWVLNSWFQEIEIATGNLLFEWDALSHIPLSETYVLPNSTDVSGTGLGAITPPDAPWDYFHLNSVDKFPNGDYLISARHASTLYRISAATGNILWRLSGPLSNFSLAAGLNFTFQHDARVLSDNSTTTVLSLFDNASDQYNQSSRYSSGKIIHLSHSTNHATLIQTFISPGEFISDSQGNCQVLDKTHWATSSVFCGWGSQPWLSEYTSDGKLVQAGHFATYYSTMNYRAFKFNYTTDPTDAPAAYVYSLHGESGNSTAETVYYVSWNGATAVRRWRVYGGGSKNGPWARVGAAQKDGFETVFSVSGYHAWSLVEAVDGEGNALRNSSRAVRTFVPGSELAQACGVLGCPVASGYSSSVSGGGKGSGSGSEGGGSGSDGGNGDGSASSAASFTRRTLSLDKSQPAGSTTGGFPWRKTAEVLVVLNLVWGLVYFCG